MSSSSKRARFFIVRRSCCNFGDRQLRFSRPSLLGRQVGGCGLGGKSATISLGIPCACSDVVSRTGRVADAGGRSYRQHQDRHQHQRWSIDHLFGRSAPPPKPRLSGCSGRRLPRQIFYLPRLARPRPVRNCRAPERWPHCGCSPCWPAAVAAIEVEDRTYGALRGRYVQKAATAVPLRGVLGTHSRQRHREGYFARCGDMIAASLRAII